MGSSKVKVILQIICLVLKMLSQFYTFKCNVWILQML